jgi:hypothetical protein
MFEIKKIDTFVWRIFLSLSANIKLRIIRRGVIFRGWKVDGVFLFCMFF